MECLGLVKLSLLPASFRNCKDPFYNTESVSVEYDFADIFYFLALAAQKYYPGQKLKLLVFTAEYAVDVEYIKTTFCITVFLDFYIFFFQGTRIKKDTPPASSGV